VKVELILRAEAGGLTTSAISFSSRMRERAASHPKRQMPSGRRQSSTPETG